MANYTILLPSGVRPGHIEALEAAIPVKNGFRFWALLFPMLFALMHRLWRPFAAMLCLTVLLGVAAAYELIADWAALLLDMMVGLYAANAAADWIVTARERNGFTAMATMPGADDDEALARCFPDVQEPAPVVSVPLLAAVLALRNSRACQSDLRGLRCPR